MQEKRGIAGAGAALAARLICVAEFVFLAPACDSLDVVTVCKTPACWSLLEKTAAALARPRARRPAESEA